ncbi:MAG: D-alanyl-D-alanine carboxypeptidase family protein [Gallionellaceae bacterium]|jgi:D-alanyl-D-alanine carboxypeptidase (penicillin-binding protein 5/6)
MKFIFSFLMMFLPAISLAMNSAPELAAKSYVLYDYSSNQILLSKNGHERFQPASLTKLMTAYVTFSAIRQGKLSINQEVIPSANVLRTQDEESRMFLEPNKPVKVDDLLRGLIIQSGNDAARVLAETVANHELAFATDLMNKEAQRLGMKNTHFVNSTGLPEDQHYSSAYDLALLAAAIVRDFPEFYQIYSMREFQYNKIKQFNRNQLLWLDPFVDGMKTGHTEAAGFCLVASAKRDQHRLISVVMGTATESLRTSESQRLLNFGFQEFELLQLYKKNQMVTSLRTWKGTEREVGIGFRNDVFITIPRGQRQLLKAAVETYQPVIAPIEKNQKIGQLKIKLNEKPYIEYPLFALDNVPVANVFSRGVDTIRLLFR